MDIQTTKFKRCHVVKAIGRIDSYTAPQLEAAFNTVIDKGESNLVFDASEITFVSSAGWWTLIRAQKNLKGRALNPGEVVLVKLDARIHESMELVGIGNFFKIFEDLTTAVGNF